MHTDAGQLVGTLQYMSPEQCDADPSGLDVRSDVYSLGVVLYQLLIGKLPYDSGGSSIYRATRVIKEASPTRLSSINRRLRGDVETIVLKALEKDRDRRYQSAADLVRDIRHYLSREPIEARRPKPWARMAHWIGRHPAVVTAVVSAAVVVLSISVSITTVWYYDKNPYNIEVEDGGQAARLVTRSGKQLHMWWVDRPGSIAEALLVDVPAEEGSERRALLGYGVTPTHGLAGQVCLFPVSEGDRNTPIWSAGIEQDDLPDSLTAQGKTAALAGVKTLFLADIFRDTPGKEVVAIHDFDASGVRAVRVLDVLSGEVLYQVWHNGDFSAWHWLPSPRLLVLMGDNCNGYWDGRGQPDAKDNRPYVIFAVRPEPDLPTNRFLSDKPVDYAASPVWYRCLYYPFAEVQVGGFRLMTPPLSADGDKTVQFVFCVGPSEDNVAIDWTIDANGRMMPGTRSGNDFYNRDKSLPPLEEFYLGDLPPRTTTAPTSSSTIDTMITP
jgi:hypothetical protein